MAGAVRAALVNAMGGLIGDAVVVGENRSELGALIILSDAAVRMEAGELEAALAEKLAEAVKSATGSASRVRRIMILAEQPSLDRGEITEKGSLNQRAMRASNSAQIACLYSGGDGVISV